MSFDKLVDKIKIFTKALDENKILRVTFESRKKEPLIRRCVPLDISPSKKTTKQTSKFHFFDLDSKPNPHTLSLDPGQILNMDITEEKFNPDEIITWEKPQHKKLDDGKYHWHLNM